MYVKETQTDEKGNFNFPKTTIINVKDKVKLREHTPFIGVIMNGYGLKLEYLFHKQEKQGLSNIMLSKRNKKRNVIELHKSTHADIVINAKNSDTNSVLSNLEYMSRNDNCFIVDVPLTLKYFNELVNNIKDNESEIYKMRAISMKHNIARMSHAYESCTDKK